MYESHFGLSAKPFALAPDTSFLFPSRRHGFGLLALKYGLANQASFALLTGEVGSGKTLMLHKLLAELGPEYRAGLIGHTSPGFGNLLQWICVAFDLDHHGKSMAGLYQTFVQFLKATHAAGTRAVLIVDEAQNLGPAQLEELRVLSNVNADRNLMLQTLLVGQPELRTLLQQPNLRQFAQRISSDYHLQGLNQQEAHDYVHHRLLRAGGSFELIRPEAIDLAWQASGGIPRLINLLCDQAMVYALGDDARFVDAATMKAVIEDRQAGGLWRVSAAS
jgi:type II secretory pathway predicted ATPase ExeA